MQKQNPKPIISIIVRCLNEQKHLPKLFKMLTLQNFQDFEVILVDSGSTDKSIEIATKNGAKVCHIEKSQFSFGRALNLGCSYANGEILVIVSAHVYPVHDNWLNLIYSEFKNFSVGIVYGKQRAGSTNKFSEAELMKSWFPDKSNFDQTSPFCNNANCAVRKSIWDKQKYDEDLSGLEDINFAKQALKENWKIIYIHDALIIHIHDETWKQIFNRYYREAIALSKIDNNIQLNLRNILYLLAKNIVSDFKEALKQKVFLRKFSEVILFRIIQFLASWRGLNRKIVLNQDLIKRFYYPNERNLDGK